MKRLVFLVVSLTLLAVVPLSAQDSTADPRTLAQYLPADTFAYIGIRTDQAYLETINNVISQVAAAAGEDVPEGGALGALAEQIERETDGQFTYESGIRAWLGDSAAVAIVDLQQSMASSNPALVLVEVAEAQALRELLASPEMNLSNYTIEEGDGFTYYKSDSRFIESLLLTDDVLYFGNAQVIDSLIANRTADTLAASPKFIAAYDALPADGYNLFGYLDGAALVEVLSAFSDPDDLPFPVDFEKLESAVNVQAFGGTIFEDRTFALDLALVYGDSSIADALGLPNLPELTLAPANPDFASIAPVDTFAYIGGSSAGTSAIVGFEYLNVVAPVLADMIEAADQDAALGIRAGLPTLVNLVRGFFTDAFDIPFNDLMAMIDGQNATFIRYSNETQNFEGAQVYENLNPALNDKVLTGAQSLLTRFDVPFEFSDGRITVDFTSLSDELYDEIGLGMSGIERVVFTLNEQYAVTGTPEAVNFVLGGSRIARLNSTPAYQHEAKFFLPNANQVWYLALAPLEALGRDMDGAQAFDSFGLTTAEGEGAALMRMTATLKAE